MHFGHPQLRSEPKANEEPVKAANNLTLLMEKLSSRNQNVTVVNNCALNFILT